MKSDVWFPTIICHDILQNIDNAKLKEYCLNKERNEPSVSQTNIGGWQSSPDTIFDSELNGLKVAIDEKMNEVMNRIGFSRKINMDNGWININRNGHYNVQHKHPMSFWSCVYYVSNPDPNSKINFYDPREVRNHIEDSSLYERHGIENYFSCQYGVVEGAFIAFPSWLLHDVIANSSDQPRISVAMNYGYE